MDAVALQIEGVSKRFPGMLAVDNVDMEVRVGEVHALMGENGAGKSTLMKTLTGAFDDYTGSIRIGGKEVRLHSPAEAIAHGIGMVYQELSLSRPVSIAENLFAGCLPTNRFGLIDHKALLNNARRCLAHVSLDIDPLKTVEEISQHEAQLVEIAKVLAKTPCILILDEPTSALSREETHRLFEIIRDLKRRGLAIVYISHHLPEVFEIADRVTVLRDGRKVDGLFLRLSVTQNLLAALLPAHSHAGIYFSRDDASVTQQYLEELGIVSSGMAFVTYSGNMADLSVPAIMAFSGIIALHHRIQDKHDKAEKAQLKSKLCKNTR